MRILGLDPGLAIVGYSILDFKNSKLKIVDYGVIETFSGDMFTDRLNIIFESINKLIDIYQPEEVAIEELFFNKNVKTAITVGHARGVEILACVRRNLDIYEYTPLQIKQAVTGFGRADKRMVQDMVALLLNMKSIPKPDDAADAIAVAITHINCSASKELFRLR